MNQYSTEIAGPSTRSQQQQSSERQFKEQRVPRIDTGFWLKVCTWLTCPATYISAVPGSKANIGCGDRRFCWPQTRLRMDDRVLNFLQKHGMRPEQGEWGQLQMSCKAGPGRKPYLWVVPQRVGVERGHPAPASRGASRRMPKPRSTAPGGSQLAFPVPGIAMSESCA